MSLQLAITLIISATLLSGFIVHWWHSRHPYGKSTMLIQHNGKSIGRIKSNHFLQNGKQVRAVVIPGKLVNLHEAR